MLPAVSVTQQCPPRWKAFHLSNQALARLPKAARKVARVSGSASGLGGDSSFGLGRCWVEAVARSVPHFGTLQRYARTVLTLLVRESIQVKGRDDESHVRAVVGHLRTSSWVKHAG